MPMHLELFFRIRPTKLLVLMTHYLTEQTKIYWTQHWSSNQLSKKRKFDENKEKFINFA